MEDESKDIIEVVLDVIKVKYLEIKLLEVFKVDVIKIE